MMGKCLLKLGMAIPTYNPSTREAEAVAEEYAGADLLSKKAFQYVTQIFLQCTLILLPWPIRYQDHRCEPPL